MIYPQFKLHRHRHIEYGIITLGEERQLVEEEVSLCKAGDLALIVSNVPYMYLYNSILYDTGDSESSRELLQFFPCIFLEHMKTLPDYNALCELLPI